MKNILFFHQSSDLYGSDKTLLYLVQNINKKKYLPIVVIPNIGPLFFELKKHNIKTIITPVLNIHKKMFTIKNMLCLPFFLFKSISTLNKELKNINIDIVVSNTVVVLLGLIYARLKKIKHFWHIHEIVESPKVATKVFPFLVNKFSDLVIFNSESTKNNFCALQSSIQFKSIVVHNGINRECPFTNEIDLNKLKEKYGLVGYKTLGLIGRINNNKGHKLLLDSFKKILIKHNKIKLIFIGSVVKGKEHILKELELKILTEGLIDNVKIIPFQKNIWPFWDLIDVAVVPSTIPESFGLVALEAMLAKKPVVASNLGGLKEVVIHGKTGYLFNVNNPRELELLIIDLLENKKKRLELGESGNKRAIDLFSLDKYVKEFDENIFAH